MVYLIIGLRPRSLQFLYDLKELQYNIERCDTSTIYLVLEQQGRIVKYQKYPYMVGFTFSTYPNLLLVKHAHSIRCCMYRFPAAYLCTIVLANFQAKQFENVHLICLFYLVNSFYGSLFFTQFFLFCTLFFSVDTFYYCCFSR